MFAPEPTDFRLNTRYLPSVVLPVASCPVGAIQTETDAKGEDRTTPRKGLGGDLRHRGVADYLDRSAGPMTTPVGSSASTDRQRHAVGPSLDPNLPMRPPGGSYWSTRPAKAISGGKISVEALSRGVRTGGVR